MRRIVLLPLLVLLVSAEPLFATCGGGGGGGTGGAVPRSQVNGQPQPDAYVVPWKSLGPDDKPLTTTLVAMWFPATAEEIGASELNVSRPLTLYAAQCVGLQLVKPDDANTIAKFDVVTKRPTVLLVADGKVVDHADARDGRLTVSSVENMIHHELFNRETTLDAQLDEAKKLADGGDKDGAVTAYQKVWEQRCVAPKKGREAQKALKRLGVAVKDADLRAVDPDLSPAMTARMTKAMRAAFAAELAA